MAKAKNAVIAGDFMGKKVSVSFGKVSMDVGGLSALELFLSTPPSRVATDMRLELFTPDLAFLSTPPSRVATQENDKSNSANHVSIHATLAGGDRQAGNQCRFVWTFLSTPPSRVATARHQDTI